MDNIILLFYMLFPKQTEQYVKYSRTNVFMYCTPALA